MAWYINDLSLCGQYKDVAEFLGNLRELLRHRQQLPNLTRELYCSRALHRRPVSPTNDFRNAVLLTDKVFVHLVLAWLTKNGPFWDDDRHPNPDDYFECLGEDVTDQGLGEAARCQIVKKQSISVSFPSGRFDFTPIEIVHGLPEEPIDTIFIRNIWDFSDLRNNALDAIPTPCNWHQMLEQAQIRFDRLTFSPQCLDKLTMQPFSAYVVERVFELLRVLDEFMQCRNADGTYSRRNNELIDQHFSGKKAWFTDESVTNKRDFKEEMTFADFEYPGEMVFCTWHGKIKTPQFRIHFEWPSVDSQALRIFYIGPKITKD